MFPYIQIRGGQVRPCWTRHKFLSPREFPSVSFLSRHLGCLTQMSSGWRWSRWLWKGLVGLTILLFSSLNAQYGWQVLWGRRLHLTWISLTPFLELPLSIASYSMAPLVLADGLWSLICSFSIIFIYSEKGVFINGSSSSYH